MITLAAFVLLACLNDDPHQCAALEETYPTMAQCEAARADLTAFWKQGMDQAPPIPIHCEDEAEHT